MFTMYDDLFLCIQKANNDVDWSEKILRFMHTMKTDTWSTRNPHSQPTNLTTASEHFCSRLLSSWRVVADIVLVLEWQCNKLRLVKMNSVQLLHGGVEWRPFHFTKTCNNADQQLTESSSYGAEATVVRGFV